MPFAKIESLEHEGRGVAHVEGKTIFIEGALPGEEVEYVSYRKKPSFENAEVVRILDESAQRVSPRCAYFGLCGGCSMQHVDAFAQVAHKQRVLEDALWHIGGRLRPEEVYPAIYGPAWGYRTRARLSVRVVPKKGGVLVGFHEKRSSYIADMKSCEVLPRHVSALLPKLRELIAGMSAPNRLPQIELAVGDVVTALVLRHLEPLTPEDESLLRQFADAQGVQWWLQPGGPATAWCFYPQEGAVLAYRLPEFQLTMPYRPTDFTQVNVGVNQMLIRRAMRLLDPKPHERVADMFCGLGNFTLPIARLGAEVLGVEGSRALLDRAAENAAANGLAARCTYTEANLFEITPESLAAMGRFDKMLIDPPREGAIELVKSLGDEAPSRIVYVSCKPGTLARDAAVLTHEKGYRLRGAGVANMFPHTSHVESIALFER
ncbi:MAG: rRNA ((1939)-C(5))-methyltransferase RlmD [Pseudomonadota bacterium]|jgi:23S rRNA (uracil1939-C5)-methyltransferase